MKMTRRLGLALGAVAALGLFAGGTASSSLASTTLGAGGSGTAIACPAIEGANSTIGCGGYPIAWFPPNGMMPGVTVSGQAMLKGSGPKVRDEAIRMAVADAKDRAEVAGEAGGMTLGRALANDPGAPCPPLSGETKADVLIVGGGYTGMWTAHFLKEREPALDVVVLEQDICGGGPSGRNGGFVNDLAEEVETLLEVSGADGATARSEEHTSE